MNLNQKIVAALASFAKPGPLHAEDGRYRVGLDVRLATPVGVEANSLEFWAARPERPERTIDELKAWARRVAARVTYLMEPLVVLEADAQGAEVEIRSQTPTLREGTRNYFEARLDRSGHLGITRLAYDESSRRRNPVPFQLTCEVLDRLVRDLVATAE
jgi:hypothetical protein